MDRFFICDNNFCNSGKPCRIVIDTEEDSPITAGCVSGDEEINWVEVTCPSRQTLVAAESCQLPTTAPAGTASPICPKCKSDTFIYSSRKKEQVYKVAAEKLWGLLDDIDTLTDVIKPTSLKGYSSFYRAAVKRAEQRHLILTSDGYSLHIPKPCAQEIVEETETNTQQQLNASPIGTCETHVA